MLECEYLELSSSTEDFWATKVRQRRRRGRKRKRLRLRQKKEGDALPRRLELVDGNIVIV